MNLPLTIALASASLLVLFGFAVAYIMFIGRCVVPCFGRRQAKHKNKPAGIEQSPRQSKVADESAARRFGWAEVESLTSGFTSGVVGEGGFSTVYLGRLSGSKPVAVKVQRSSERLRRAFLQELDVLRRIDHPNIVRLVGYCDEHDEGVLVFDYVPNGTLFDNLHGRRRLRVLTWTERMRIAYRVALAVAYLHGGSGALQIVHGDLTSSNVLLDNELKPLLCDLGSATVGFSAAVAPAGGGGRRRQLLLGSPGYADPLLMRTGVVSKKTDVYSFGVLLLELITGRPAFIEEEERFLTAAVGPVVRDVEGNKEKVRGILDIRLGVEVDEEELMTTARLVGRCIDDRPGMRPSMAEISAIMREMGSDGREQR